MKSDYRKTRIYNLYFSTISILGLLFLVLMLIYAPTARIVYNFQKPVILSIFILICLLGMLASVYPSRCSEFPRFKKKEIYENGNKLSEKKFEGHHPDCDVFSGHIFYFMGKKYCAGCTGLFIGALIAVIGTIVYYFYGIIANSSFIFGLGTVLVFISLIQNILYNVNVNVLKFIFNLFLVLGSFMILVGINENTNNLFIEIYFLILVIIWILDRISSSEKNHILICTECGMESSCNYK